MSNITYVDWQLLIIITLLVIYTALTVVNTVKPRSMYATFGQFTRFIPRYSFFAPDAGVASLEFAYRDHLTDGRTTDWRDVEDIRFTISWWTWVWNPKRTRQKALDVMGFWLLNHLNHVYDVGNDTINLRTLDDDINHHSHEMLVRFAVAQPHHQQATATQFRINQSLRSEDHTRTMLISRAYTLNSLAHDN